MDIYCPKCREPWDLDSLHEEVSMRWPEEPWKVNGKHDQTIYEQYLRTVRQDFTANGCKALTGFGARCIPDTPTNPILSEVYELMGDDMDGAAAFLDDMKGLW